MANDPKLLGEALQKGAAANTKPKQPPLPRLGYKSNARNPERMSPANAQKYSGIGPKGKPA